MRVSILFKLANTLHNFCLGLLTFGSMSLLESSGGLGYCPPTVQRLAHPRKSIHFLHFSGCHFLPRGFGVSLTRTVIVVHPRVVFCKLFAYTVPKAKRWWKTRFFLDRWGNRHMCDYPDNGIVRIRLPPRSMYGCNLLWQRQVLPSALSFPLGSFLYKLLWLSLPRS